MSTAKITLFGMWKWFEDRKQLGGTEELFDFFQLPALPDSMETGVVINNILLRGGEFEVLYANPDFMRTMIATWAAKWHHTFKRWCEALSVDYEPLENYDRREEETRTPDITHLRTPNLQSERTANLTNQRTPDLTDTNGGTITGEHTVSAFDSSSYQPHERDVTTPNNTLHTTGTDTVRETGTDTTKETGTESNRESGTEKWERRAHGNIGVTTSQQMLESELAVAEWNLVEHITDVFLREFVIPIYS